jgi:hypothetical protein
MYYADPDTNNERIARHGSRIMRLDLFSATGIRSFSIHNPGQTERGPHQFDQASKLLGRLALKPVRFEWTDLRDQVSTVDDVSLQH